MIYGVLVMMIIDLMVMKIDEWSVDDANRKRAYKRDRNKKKKVFILFLLFFNKSILEVNW